MIKEKGKIAKEDCDNFVDYCKFSIEGYPNSVYFLYNIRANDISGYTQSSYFWGETVKKIDIAVEKLNSNAKSLHSIGELDEQIYKELGQFGSIQVQEKVTENSNLFDLTSTGFFTSTKVVRKPTNDFCLDLKIEQNSTCIIS